MQKLSILKIDYQNNKMNLLTNIKLQRNLAIIIAIVAILFIHRCTPSDPNIDTLKQNITALNDSIRTYKDKNGQLVYEKAAFISENGDLKKLNKELDDEIKYLKDHPLVVIKTVIKIVHDTVFVPVKVGGPVILKDGSVSRNLTWNLDKEFSKGNYRKLGGDLDVIVDSNLNLTSSPMHITTDELGLSLTTGLTENGDFLEIFVKSPYPGFTPTSINGSLIDPKKSEVLKRYFPPKKWAVGIYGGYGIYFDPRSFDIGNGVLLGVGVQYNILQWNFKK